MKYSVKQRFLPLGLFIIIFCMGLNEMALAQSAMAIPTADQQIGAAVMAAPKAMRSGAKVYGYTQQGEWTTLREGSNQLICLADDPEKANFHVACYFKDLEPFMKRGRELRAEGKSHIETDDMRQKEIEAGTLAMPQKAMALYNLSGDKNAYDYKTGTLQKATPLNVVYVPFGTQKSTGITTAPAGPGAPWLMEAGLPWAHIMIPGRLVGEDVDN